jgi:tripartite-type tricarboxylate transporter receptor subunit TctC
MKNIARLESGQAFGARAARRQVLRTLALSTAAGMGAPLAALYPTAGAAQARPASGAAPPPVSAAAWPTGLVRIVVGYPPGGPNDLVARAVGQQLGIETKQPVIIDNRAGASGIIGAEYVARAAPDGQTLMLNASTHTTLNALYPKLSFDAYNDFTPITMVGTSTLVLVVNPEVPARTLKELIALIESRPGKIAFASTGFGGTPHLAGEMFKQMGHLDITHVPYKGSAPAMTDLLGGQVQMMIETLPSAAPQIRAGKIRALAVTSARRSPGLPDVPTMAEAGLPGFDMTVWWGIFGPARMAPALADRIGVLVNDTLKTTEIRERFASLAIEPAGTTTEGFRAVLRADIDKYAKVIKEGNIHVE